MFAFIEAAGWPVWPLVLASVISLAIIGERAWSLRSNVVVPPDLLPKVVQEFRQNGGKVWLCGACTKPRGITDQHLAPGVTIVGAATIVEAIAKGTTPVAFA